jgi:hypothetical protein
MGIEPENKDVSLKSRIVRNIGTVFAGVAAGGAGYVVSGGNPTASMVAASLAVTFQRAITSDIYDDYLDEHGYDDCDCDDESRPYINGTANIYRAGSSIGVF